MEARVAVRGEPGGTGQLHGAAHAGDGAVVLRRAVGDGGIARPDVGRGACQSSALRTRLSPSPTIASTSDSGPRFSEVASTIRSATRWSSTGERAPGVADRAAHHRLAQQLILGLEPPVHRAGRQPRLAHDTHDLGARVALRGKRRRRIQHRSRNGSPSASTSALSPTVSSSSGPEALVPRAYDPPPTTLDPERS
jgi:hypothetical protein